MFHPVLYLSASRLGLWKNDLCYRFYGGPASVAHILELGNQPALCFARDCCYITVQQHVELTSLCSEIGKMLGSMINNTSPFLTADRGPLASAF
jgi:hypothetical protein